MRLAGNLRRLAGGPVLRHIHITREAMLHSRPDYLYTRAITSNDGVSFLVAADGSLWALTTLRKTQTEGLYVHYSSICAGRRRRR